MQATYLKIAALNKMPRIPAEGSIDLTYRCNNNCRHCWLRISPEAVEKNNELTFEQIKSIVNQAKAMGCCKWSISGGEPMLRPDFAGIFDYLTVNSSFYSLNTNGTLITPKIAKLLKRKGNKMVALYGATSQVHDSITRNPGSFEATLGGFKYLKEAAAGFTVQLIPMRDNYHQFPEMVRLAQSLSKHYRIGAPWFHLSACGDRKINQQIKGQRLEPKEVVELNKPDLSYAEWMKNNTEFDSGSGKTGQYLFSSCAAGNRSFNIDPYAKMSFCYLLKDPSFRYDLRKGNFQEGWEKFIPALARKVKITPEYRTNCGSCPLRQDCRSCPAYAYLEHGRYGAKIDYLCAVAKENRKFKASWQESHRCYFRTGGITIQFESDLPIKETTFHPKFKDFKAPGPTDDMVRIRQHFALPELSGRELGREVYRKAPWAIYKKDATWIYLGISPNKRSKRLHRIAVFDSDHLCGRIYNNSPENFIRGNLHSLTLFPSDQIILARILADRQGCYLHACGVNFAGQGMLFAGDSGAGKSTLANILTAKAQILCDDRMIIRKSPNGFNIYGTWSHGDVAEVCSASAPLKAILFLKKSKENRIIPLIDKKEITRRLLGYVIKPLVTVDWWRKTLSLIEQIGSTVACYELYFDKSGKVVELLKGL